MAAFLLLSAPQAFAGPLTVNLAGSGAGTVTGSGANLGHSNVINCTNTGNPGGPKTGACSFADFGFFETVTLTATPDPGFELAAWTGDAAAGTCNSGNASPCSFPSFASLVTVTATFAPAVVAPVVAIDPVDEGVDIVTPSGGFPDVTFHGSVDPNNEDGITACRFEYLTEAQYQANSPASRFSGAAQVPCSPMPTDEADPVDVSATVKGLTPDTGYRVRLLASKFGAADAVDEAAPFDVPAIPPIIARQRAWQLTDDAATLLATVNPAGNAVTTCSFQYVTQAQFDVDGFATASTAPCTPAAPGAGLVAVGVSAQIADLEADTAYRFRLVADNGAPLDPECASDCETLAAGPDTGLATYPAFAFPARGYELVSAFDTNGVNSGPDTASADGNHYAYSNGPVPVPGCEDGWNCFFRSSRQLDGSWMQTPIGPSPPAPHQIGSTPLGTYPLYSADLSHAAFSARADLLDPDDQNDGYDAYMKVAGVPGFTWLSSNRQGDIDDSQGGPSHVSSDGSRVLLTSTKELLPGVGIDQLYEWKSGDLSLVSAKPGSAAGFAGVADIGSMSMGEMTISRRYRMTRNSVSVDGRRVAFQSGDSSVKTAPRLFVRLTDGGETVEASAPAPGTAELTQPCFNGGPVGPCDVNYWGADRDTQQVFFTSTSRLTPDSDAVNSGALGGEEGFYNSADRADLYRYTVPADGDPASGELVNLTPNPGGAGVFHVLRVSDDARRVYFMANAALAPGASPGSCNRAGGVCNLYLAELDGPSDTDPDLTHIATMMLRYGSGVTSLAERARNIAADPAGAFFAFLATEELVPGQQTGGLAQVYLYDAVRGSLACASCPADGSAPASMAALAPSNLESIAGVEPFSFWGAAVRFNANWPGFRNVTAEGSVFFATDTGLSGDDVNGFADLYEYRTGRLDLVTSGVAPVGAVFADASVDGSTVFFRVRDALVPGADNGFHRIYAARVGGGAPTPPLLEPRCVGEDCKPAATSPPGHSAPSSGAVSGRGNVVERRSCVRPVRQARLLARMAKRLRRAAVRSSDPVRSRAMLRRATSVSRSAKRRSAAARRCLAQARRARAERGAGR